MKKEDLDRIHSRIEKLIGMARELNPMASYKIEIHVRSDAFTGINLAYNEDQKMK